MSPLPLSFTRLIERGPEGAAEFLQNVRPVTVAREPEEMPAAAGDDLCWIWQGPGVNCVGYAREDHELVHRRAYALFHGEIPEGKQVIRTCGQSSLCVNPRHLALATRAEISSRANLSNRLTPEQREEVKKALASGQPQTTVARRFGISQGAVSTIKNKREFPFTPADAEQADEADQHPAQSLTEWLDRQARRLGPIGQLARGEAMPDEQREKAFSKATKEFLTYQLLSREYETRRRENC
jgi:hypothetical protein